MEAKLLQSIGTKRDFRCVLDFVVIHQCHERRSLGLLQLSLWLSRREVDRCFGLSVFFISQNFGYHALISKLIRSISAWKHDLKNEKLLHKIEVTRWISKSLIKIETAESKAILKWDVQRIHQQSWFQMTRSSMPVEWVYSWPVSGSWLV